MSEEINQGWQNTPQLNKLAASQQGGNRGAQLWGVQFNGTVNTIYQITPGGSWSQWMGNDWAGPGFPKQVYELAAAQQNNECVQFWGLDSNLELWTTSQSSPGGDWVTWSGPGWNNAPKGMKGLLHAALSAHKVHSFGESVKTFQSSPVLNRLRVANGAPGRVGRLPLRSLNSLKLPQQSKMHTLNCGRSTATGNSGLAGRLLRAAVGYPGMDRIGMARRLSPTSQRVNKVARAAHRYGVLRRITH